MCEKGWHLSDGANRGLPAAAVRGYQAAREGRWHLVEGVSGAAERRMPGATGKRVRLPVAPAHNRVRRRGTAVGREGLDPLHSLPLPSASHGLVQRDQVRRDGGVALAELVLGGEQRALGV